jgi:hypothetical protein
VSSGNFLPTLRYNLTYNLITYLLTYSMEQSPSLEANRFAAGQEIPAFYGTRRFNTAFTSARHLPLSCASSIRSIPLHPASWRSALILSSHLRLGLPISLFPSGLPTETLYTPLHSPIHATFGKNYCCVIVQNREVLTKATNFLKP